MAKKALSMIAGAAMIGFGIWHFFVPSAWNWYDYIAAEATELVIAVRAINVFFSLCLVLFGILSIVFAFAVRERLPRILLLCVLCALWVVRVFMQLIYPQGSASAFLQYGMLAAFIIIFFCYVACLLLELRYRFNMND